MNLNQRTKSIIMRAVIYLTGLFIMSLGITISVRSNLGVTPVSSIPYVFSQISGIRLGVCTTGIYLIFILTQFLILRKDFKPWSLLQVIGSFLFGIFITGAEWIAALLPHCGNYGMQLLYLLVSMPLLGLGIMLYMSAEILPLPAEGVMGAVSQKSGKPLSTCKILFDCTMVIIAVAVSFALTGRLMGIREGTLISAVGVGKCIQLFSALWKQKVVTVLFGPEKEMAA